MDRGQELGELQPISCLEVGLRSVPTLGFDASALVSIPAHGAMHTALGSRMSLAKKPNLASRLNHPKDSGASRSSSKGIERLTCFYICADEVQ